MREGGRVKTKEGQEGSKGTTETNNVAVPEAESDKGESSGTEVS